MTLEPREGPTQETVVVGGRTLTLADWEGEVMVRAVGVYTILQNALGLLLIVPVMFRVHSLQMAKTVLLSMLGVTVEIQVAVILAGKSVLRRGKGGRMVLIILHGLSFLCVGGGLLAGSFIGPPMGAAIFRGGVVSILSTCIRYVPMLFTLYVLLVFPGRRAFEPPLSLQPLAPLGSVRSVSGTARGWVSVGMIAIVLLGFLLGAVRLLLPV